MVNGQVVEWLVFRHSREGGKPGVTCRIVSANEVRRCLTVNWWNLDPRLREDDKQKRVREMEK